ncbi:hypothetical protein [Cytobacillus purgationiresistens]|uniref:Uncharacterized protein n=1 Tax=Cytobacillus purgationiresistens TaxID=863449 RepID=A0ABU0ABD1_9BACI|nr:hypothetical protein [Cytobacillus purgationiresistens]MDQ0268557.1 hypothetical protein [Cytobacillus purgationiresistens]
MIWLMIPIGIWIIALLIMVMPKFVVNKLQQIELKLMVNAELEKYTNPNESIFKYIEKSILDTIHIQNMSLISSIIGLVLIALGTLALCLVLLL